MRLDEAAAQEWQGALAALQTLVIVRTLNRPNSAQASAEERRALAAALYGLPAASGGDPAARAAVETLSGKVATMTARDPSDVSTMVVGIDVGVDAGRANPTPIPITVASVRKERRSRAAAVSLQTTALRLLQALLEKSWSLPQLGSRAKLGPELFSSEPRLLKRTLSAALQKCNELLTLVEHTAVKFGTKHQEKEKYQMQVFLENSRAKAYKTQVQENWKKDPKNARMDVVVRDKTDWHNLSIGTKKKRAHKRGKSSKAGDAAADTSAATESHLTEISSVINNSIQDMDWPAILERYLEMEAKQEPFTFEALELKKIAADDVRKRKRGCDGVFVRAGYNLPARTCLGPYVTQVSFDTEYQEALDPGEGNVREPYLHEFGTSSDWGEMFDETNNKRLNDMVGDAYICGNILRNISDCRADPIQHPLGHDGDKKNNCLFVEVLHYGWPYVFVVTTEAVAGGQEILMDHSNAFWEHYVESMMHEDFHRQVARRLRGSVQKIKAAEEKLVAEYPELKELEKVELEPEAGGEDVGGGGAAA